MNIIVHEEAAKSFEKIAHDLVSKIIELPKEPPASRGEQPEFLSDVTLTGKDIIGDVIIGISDVSGQEQGKGFFVDGKELGLVGTSYRDFRQLVTNIQRVAELRYLVSLKFVADHTFIWIKDTFLKKISTAYMDYLLEAIDNSVKEYEVWIPIPFTSIQSELSIGRVTFRNITAAQISAWSSVYLKNNHSPDENEKIDQYEHNLRKKYQGSAAGFLKCMAEPDRAIELAYFHLSRSLSILRLFSPANHFLDIVSGAYEYGQKMIETKACFIMSPALPAFREKGEIMDKGMQWAIGDALIQNIKRTSLVEFDYLLKTDSPTMFQSDLLDALLTYSKNTLKRDMSDKILYILVGLESILLKNASEPIQQNLADRIAFGIGRNLEERQRIVEVVKAVYGIRSKYIHHGSADYGDLDQIREFLGYTWRMFLLLVQNSSKFASRQEFIAALEKVKYS